MAYDEKRYGRKTGLFVGQVDQRGQGSQRFKKVFDTKAKAEAYEAHIKAHNEEPGWALTGSPVDALTFKQAAEQALAAGGPNGVWKHGRDRSVIDRLRFIMGSKLGSLPLDKVSYANVEDYTNQLSSRPARGGGPMSDRTINRHVTAISAVLEYAVNKRLIEAKTKLPWRKESGQGRKHWLQEGQERLIANALRLRCHDDAAFCVLVLVATGMRWSELAGLEPSQIIDPVGTNRNGRIELWETKTNHPRSIPVVPDMARELRAFVAAKRVPLYITMCKWFKQAVKDCGLDPGLTLHALRHTACTRRILGGHSQLKVQQFMGHSSPKTTALYFHMLDSDIDDLAENPRPHGGLDTSSADIVPIRKLG